MLGVICVGIIGINTPAGAGVQNYPLCAIYSDGVVGGITNYGFTTFETMHRNRSRARRILPAQSAISAPVHPIPLATILTDTPGRVDPK